MASRLKRTTSPASSQATEGGRRMMLRQEPLFYFEPSDICTYWPGNPAFDHKRVLLRRMFFIFEDKTKYMSAGFYPARDYQPLVEFGAILRGGSKSLILTDEKITALAYCLPAIRDSMCVGGDRVFIKCESGNFRLYTPKRHGSARMFVGTDYISLPKPDMGYLVRVFHILQQQLRDYIIALPDVLSYVTSSLASASYIEPQPNASTNLD